MPDGGLGSAYRALGDGDTQPLLALLGPEFEWIEPELPGYPLAGTHRGPQGLDDLIDRLARFFDGVGFQAEEIVEGEGRVVVTGTMVGRPAGANDDWVLPFAHVWELDGEVPVRARAYFDRSRLAVAATRRELADVADDLLEQAAEIRRQWARLGDALRAAGVDADDELPPRDEDAEDAEGVAPAAGTASVRLAAVDMASEGATREEVDAFLREEHGVEDTAPILDEVFGLPGDAPDEGPLDERAAAIEAKRLSRLFARNRN